MKYIFILLLLVTTIHSQSSNASPNALFTDAVVSAAKPDYTIIEYFSFDSLNATIAQQQWYAFLTMKAPSKKFWMRFHVYFSTISKEGGEASESKAQCQADHNDLHNCFISHKRINIKKQNLVVKIVFQEDILLSIQLEVNTVKPITLGETLTINKAWNNFTRLYRMNVADLGKFDYLKLSFRETVEVDEYNNAMAFEVAFEEMPPDATRFNAASIPLWDNEQVSLFSFEELQEVNVITILCGITDLNTYSLFSNLTIFSNEVTSILPSDVLHEIADQSKSYKVQLPSRESNLYYLLRIKIDSTFDFNMSDARVNGGNSLSQLQLLKLLMGQGSSKSNNQFDIWLNSTVLTFEFTLTFKYLSIYAIDLAEFDINFITLKQKVKWNDQLALNQTQYVYIVIDTKKSEESLNFEVESAFIDQSYLLTFRNCVEKEVTQCQQIATSNNDTKKSIGMPVIKPVKNMKGMVKFFRFSNYSITKHEIQPFLYRSIVVVEVVALRQRLPYEMRWHIVNPVQMIKENELVQGKLEPDEPRIFSFTILDASNLAFARVHFLHGTVACLVFGSEVLVDPEQLINKNDLKGLVYEFDGSVTFTNLVSKGTYYVYAISPIKDLFELTLTYGYNLDDQLDHPVSFLTLGEHSTNQIVLQPQEVLFIEVRSQTSTLLTVTNTVPLKICDILQIQAPKTHKDISKSQYCETYSTVNHFFTYSFQNSGHFYVGIQNQNTRPASVLLETDNTLIMCVPANLGRTKYMMIDKTVNKTAETLCVRYQIPEKGEIEVLVDLKNPKLQGIALPEIKIGHTWHSVMTSNIAVISAEDIDSYCKQIYQECYLIIEIQKNENHRIDQDFITVTASYTTQPLPLKDGLAHHSKIANGPKMFKYPIYTHEDIVATAQSHSFEKIILYGRLITSEEKFTYPTKQDAVANKSDIFLSTSAGYFYPITLKISQDDLKKKCQNPYKLCYALFSVYSDIENNLSQGSFTIQVTQSINTLTTGNRLEKYLQKDSKAYFNYRNRQNDSTLLIFTTSNVKDCLKIDLFNGNNGPNSAFAIASGIQEVVINDAKVGWYTISVSAKETCYFTIQASSSKKAIRQLVAGYANYFKLAAGQKSYYMIHNHNLDHLKVVASLSQKHSGQLMLQGMPVPDDSLPDFIKFINGEDLGKRSKLSFIWSDINHIYLRSSDPRFCKECYICFEAQANKDIEGYLTIPSDNKYSIFLGSYISYDILLANQSFTWFAGVELTDYDVFLGLQAGQMEVTVESSQKQQWKKSLKFDKTDSSKNALLLSNITVKKYGHINIRISALANIDYSIYSTPKSAIDRPDEKKLNFVEVGRPNYLYLYDKTPACFDGKLAEEKNQFVVTSSENSLDIVFTVQGKEAKLVRENTPSVLRMSLDPSIAHTGQFRICFSISEPQKSYSGSFMYLGSLNYFPENQLLHVRNSINLTFMSEGRGVIEVDQCASRSIVSLNSQFRDVKSMGSRINSRRTNNNLIVFNYHGTIFMHVESPDSVALSWKNTHRTTFNGFGYDIFSPSTFRIAFDSSSQDVSVRVRPIEQTGESKEVPIILSINYHVFVAAEQLDLFNAMNCEKGKYMYWLKHVEAPEEIGKDATVKLNKIEDLKSLFRGKEYVLIVVKAEVMMKWQKNNFTERYRFYYPYQELLLSQFHTDQLTEEDQTNPQTPSSSEGFSNIVFIAVAAIVVAFFTILAIRWLRKKYRQNVFTTEFQEQRSEANENGTELSTKIQSGTYDAPK